MRNVWFFHTCHSPLTIRHSPWSSAAFSRPTGCCLAWRSAPKNRVGTSRWRRRLTPEALEPFELRMGVVKLIWADMGKSNQQKQTYRLLKYGCMVYMIWWNRFIIFETVMRMDINGVVIWDTIYPARDVETWHAFACVYMCLLYFLLKK